MIATAPAFVRPAAGRPLTRYAQTTDALQSGGVFNVGDAKIRGLELVQTRHEGGQGPRCGAMRGRWSARGTAGVGEGAR